MCFLLSNFCAVFNSLLVAVMSHKNIKCVESNEIQLKQTETFVNNGGSEGIIWCNCIPQKRPRRTLERCSFFKIPPLKTKWHFLIFALLFPNFNAVYFGCQISSDGIRPVRTGSQQPVLGISLIPRTGSWHGLPPDTVIMREPVVSESWSERTCS